jgi:hypothetical protein
MKLFHIEHNRTETIDFRDSVNEGCIFQDVLYRIKEYAGVSLLGRDIMKMLSFIVTVFAFFLSFNMNISKA